MTAERKECEHAPTWLGLLFGAMSGVVLGFVIARPVYQAIDDNAAAVVQAYTDCVQRRYGNPIDDTFDARKARQTDAYRGAYAEQVKSQCTAPIQ